MAGGRVAAVACLASVNFLWLAGRGLGGCFRLEFGGSQAVAAGRRENLEASPLEIDAVQPVRRRLAF